MNKTTIKIKQICKKNLVTREDGMVIHNLILDKWNKFDQIEIDFGNILIASVSFLDEALGKLASDLDVNEIRRKIHLKNIQDFDRNLVNTISISRLRQKKQVST